MAKPRQKVPGGYWRRLLSCRECHNVSYFAPPRGWGNRDIDRDGSTDRGKEDNDEGEIGHEEGMKEGPLEKRW